MFTNAALYTDRDPPDDALLRGLTGVERVEVTDTIFGPVGNALVGPLAEVG